MASLGIPTRINNPFEIDHHFIEEDLKKGQPVILQFSRKSYDDHLLEEIDTLCSRNNALLEVRFYGHSFDCSTLLKIPHVKSIRIDCVENAYHTECLTKMDQLESLHLGIYELLDTEILSSDNLKNLRALTVYTEKKALNLTYLCEYEKLKTLQIGGKTKHLEAIGNVSALEFLSLNSISRTPLHFVLFERVKNL
ncbi:hypothetical protein ACQCN2_17170 [Brevibacillus ginsengisoli]|uniref:hypothetical protein n=1 Tax=Brevibacillus ginsengisoli TaxID=363854 RepID=UPI003CF1F48E